MITLIFTNPFYLWLLVSIPFLIITHFFILKYLKRRAIKFANFEAIKRVTGTKFELRNVRAISKNRFLLVIRVFILLLLIFSIAGPVLWYSGQSSEFDFVIAIDASSSMLADDLKPYRLDAARKASSLFVDSLKAKTRVGVVSFAGTSFVEQDLIDNMKKTEDVINNIKIKSVGGTDIGGAITTSSNLLLREENARVIILLTDGQSTVGMPVDEAIDYANRYNVVVHTIGMGTKEGGQAEYGLSTLDEDSLKSLAYNTNGKYFSAENKENLTNAFSSLFNLTEMNVSIELFDYLLIIALILIVLEFLLNNTRYIHLP